MRTAGPDAVTRLVGYFQHASCAALLQALAWRYATKKRDPAKKVAQDKVDRILEAVRLTASGLQPYEVFVVTNDALREQIKVNAWNQAQVTDSSHLLVFAAWDNDTADRINAMFDLVNLEHGIRNQGWKRFSSCASADCVR